ncbi:MAG: CsgG/HfaB family protein [Gemmatimonadota bacterium]|jgi:TolB-like protein
MGARLVTVSVAVALAQAAWVGTAQAQAAQEDHRPGVAVLRFDNGGSHGDNAEAGDFDALEVGLQQMLLTELSQSSDLRIIERGRLNALLAEQDLAAEGRAEKAGAAQIGKLVGARYVVLGSFTDLFGQFRMDARVVDVETGDVLDSESVMDRREKIYDLLVDLAGKIIADVNLPALPAETTESRKSRNIPAEAITLFSRAQVFADGGHKDRAIQLYRRLTDEFPDMVQAKEALQQLTGPGA